MLKTNEMAKENIKDIVGLSTHEISKMESCKFDERLSRMTGKEIKVVARSDKRMPGRGSPLIAKGRLRYIKDTDRKLRKIKL